MNRKRDCISQLVYQMCEEGAIEMLVSLDFAGFASEVDDALAFKARNTDPRARPFYSRILYTWYTRRGDHRNGRFLAIHLNHVFEPSNPQLPEPCINVHAKCRRSPVKLVT